MTQLSAPVLITFLDVEFVGQNWLEMLILRQGYKYYNVSLLLSVYISLKH